VHRDGYDEIHSPSVQHVAVPIDQQSGEARCDEPSGGPLGPQHLLAEARVVRTEHDEALERATCSVGAPVAAGADADRIDGVGVQRIGERCGAADAPRPIA
jgi:hypothetical protein